MGLTYKDGPSGVDKHGEPGLTPPMPVVRQQFFLFQRVLENQERESRATIQRGLFECIIFDNHSTGFHFYIKKKLALLLSSKHNEPQAVIHKGPFSLTHSFTEITRAVANKSLTYELDACSTEDNEQKMACHRRDTWHGQRYTLVDCNLTFSFLLSISL